MHGLLSNIEINRKVLSNMVLMTKQLQLVAQVNSPELNILIGGLKDDDLDMLNY